MFVCVSFTIFHQRFFKFIIKYINNLYLLIPVQCTLKPNWLKISLLSLRLAILYSTVFDAPTIYLISALHLISRKLTEFFFPSSHAKYSRSIIFLSFVFFATHCNGLWHEETSNSRFIFFPVDIPLKITFNSESSSAHTHTKNEWKKKSEKKLRSALFVVCIILTSE